MLFLSYLVGELIATGLEPNGSSKGAYCDKMQAEGDLVTRTRNIFASRFRKTCSAIGISVAHIIRGETI